MTQTLPGSCAEHVLYPLTAPQLDIWLDQVLHGDSPLYNIGGYARINGVVDAQRMQTAVNQVVNRHDALRIQLVPGSAEHPLPRQRFLGTASVPLTVHDLCDHDDPHARALALLQENLQTPFSFDGGLLLRADLLKVREDLYYFFVNCHHLIIDGWSFAMIGRAISEAYTALHDGTENAVTAPTYQTYIEQQDAVKGSAAFQRQRQYWLDKYQTLPEPLLAPRHLSRFGQRLAPSQNHAWRLPRALYNRLAEQAKASGQATVFHVMLGVLYSYFARTEQRDEIVIGLPILNRANATHKATLGLFVGMSPVRLSLGTDLSFSDLIARIALTLKQDYRYQRFPLSELNRELGLQNLGRRQLFDVVVSYEQDQDTWYGPAPAQPVKLSNGYEQVPLAMHIRESAPEDDVWMHFIYNEAYLDATQIVAMQQRFMNILQSVATDFDVSVSALDPMPSTERQLLQEWNRTDVDYPKNVLLHQLIEAQVAARPEAIAVRFADQALTYDELNRQANRLAHALLDTGIGPDDRVAICLERSLEMVVGLLGILKAGAAYVPLDPGYPADRLSHMLSDSAPSALLTTHVLLASLPAVTTPVLCLDTDQGLSRQPEHNPDSAALGLTPRHLAYVIYTSGSTGLPKGVMNQHDGVVNRLLWARDAYRVDEHSRILQKTPFSFDVSVWEFFLPLLSGAQLIVAAPDGHKDPRYLMDIMASAGITLLHFVPSMLQVFLDQVEPLRLPVLKQVLCSGEALPHALQKRFFEHLPQVQLHNLYGPTEAAIDVTAWHCRPDVHDGIVPIGRPIANIQMHVLDANLQLLPPGVAGELHIGGIGVARGYLNRPELTAERFVRDPFHSEPQARLYKTGDLGRWLPDGSLEYLGRNDFQVKIRGLRIELGEIEAHLLACEGVKEAVVIAGQQAGDAYLSAYWVSEPGCTPSAHGLLETLRQHVPDYMLPRHLVELEQFPLNANGKLDRKALPEPTALAGTDTTAPRTALEQALAELWKENLKRSTLGIHDNYFMLGGDSLKVIHLQINAREQGIALTLAQVYQAPTIAQLAQVLEAEQTSTTGLAPLAHVASFAQVPPAIRLASEGVFDDVFAASQLQVGMIYHSMMHPDSAIYHDIFRYRLRLRWDEAAWNRACGALIQRHPALRMSFDIGHAEVPMARVHSTVEPPVQVVDVCSLSADARTQAIGAYVEERKRYREDWQRAPLYQFCVFVAQDEIELVFSFHHAILDGWSVATLMRDLITLYTSAPGTDALPVLTTTPADFAVLEQQAIEADAHRRFWREYLHDAPAAAMTSWIHVVAPDATPHRSAYRELPAADLARLEAFCQARDLPLRAVLLTAHGFAQAIMSNQKEVLCGVISHGRPEFEDAASVLGLFLNTLPVRFSSQGKSWLEMIHAAIAQEQQVFPHRRYPFALIHRETDVALNVVFNYVDFYVLNDLLAQGEEVLTDWETTEASNYDLLTTLGRHPANGSLMLKMDYRTARVATSQVDAYADYLLRTLQLMIAAPEATPAIPAWLPPIERTTPSATKTLPHGNLSALLLDSFARHGDQIAVSLGQAHLSYRQLQDACAQLVSWLHQEGIGQGDRVAIMMPRSPDLIVALLGVVQAGAAYVPIDLSYPNERIQLILEDSQPRLVLFADASASLAMTLAGHVDTRHWDSVVAGFDGNLAESHQRVAAIAAGVMAEDNAYVLYTSGSTGRPKGVAMPHQALTNMILWQNRQQARGADAAQPLKTLQYAPISFDVSFQEIFSTLSSGQELVMIDEGLRYDFIRLLKFIGEHQVNRLFVPYVAFQGLAEVATQLGIHPASLRQINVAGEQLKITGEIRALIDRLEDCRVENHYGPTEAHVVTCLRLEGPAATWPSMPSIGTPIDGVRMHALDAAGNPCSIGVIGDLFVEGTCLANGYWNRPDLTDERFIYRQLEGQPRRLYETGDIGFYLPGGELVYQGRSDAQVKIRGYRVELGEIEVAMLGSARFRADIEQVAVIDKAASDGSRYLVGFVQALPGCEPDLDQLKAEMRLALPDYMVPNTLVRITTLPLGPTGKIDRQRLQKIEVQTTLQRPFIGPRNALEDLLQAYWQETLDLDSISIHDNFFELGGNSLKAVQLVAMLARHQGLEPSLSDFIQAPTIAEFARVLQQAETGHPGVGALVDFRNASRRPTLFLVHPIGGHVLCYAALARVLKDQVHLYALQAPGTWDAREPLQSVQAQAVYYADAIEKVAPEGPLNIGGWSYGGVVAYELASELQRRGRRLHNVFLLDTIVRVRHGEVQIERSEFMNWFMWELLSGDGQKEYDYHALDFSTLDDPQAFTAIRQHGIDQGIFDETITLATLDQLFRVFHANWQGLLGYRFPPLDLPITLFAADVELPDVLQAPHELVGTAFRDPYRGWRSIAPQVQRIAVEGDHLTMMRSPHIERVGQCIQSQMDLARARNARHVGALA